MLCGIYSLIKSNCLRSAAAGEGKARGLPSGVHLADLVPTKTEPIVATHDEGNPEMHCEFFDTRQVRSTQSKYVAPCAASRTGFDERHQLLSWAAWGLKEGHAKCLEAVPQCLLLQLKMTAPIEAFASVCCSQK